MLPVLPPCWLGRGQQYAPKPGVLTFSVESGHEYWHDAQAAREKE
jgi:hypothetical protein